MNKVTQAIVLKKVMEGNIDLSLTHLYDGNGNPRFVEGSGVPLELTGFDVSYCKWSLSGTHLMLVLAGTFDNGTTIPINTILASFTLPDFIKNKIIPVWGNDKLSVRAVVLYADDWSTQSIQIQCLKTSAGIMFYNGATPLTMTAKRNLRMQFDLLIDSE